MATLQVALGPLHVDAPKTSPAGQTAPRISEASFALIDQLLSEQRGMIREFTEVTLQNEWKAVELLSRSDWDLSVRAQ